MTIAPPNPRSVAETLNRAARRIFQAGRQEEWTSAVLDAALGFCGRSAVFTLQGAHARLERASFDCAVETRVPLAEAPAVAQAAESLEPVAAAWSARELSRELMDCFAWPSGGRAFLFPVASAGKPVGLLVCAAGENHAPDLNGLELVATLAGAAWELRRRRNDVAPAASTGLIALGPTGGAAADAPRNEIAAADSEWHRRARRFASVRVAELRLYQAAKVREGRAAQNLYDLFQEAIDRERATFRAQFMEKSPSMVDYLHDELVRTLAQGEPGRLGENYPGAMVRN